MESYEATRSVFLRLQNIDPENASKVMGYILLQHGEKDMIRFAYGPETLIISIVNRAKSDLGLTTPTPPTPTPLVNPISNPIAISRPNPLSLSLSLSPRGFNPSSPSSPSLWSPHPHSLSPTSNHSSLSYAAVVNGTTTPNNNINDDPFWENSYNEMYYGTDESTSGFGFKPCLYYTKGFCKNGSSCNFVHGGGDNSSVPSVDAYEEEILRSKLVQQQRLAAQLMASGVNLPYNKFNLLQYEAQRSAAAALMAGEEFHKLNRVRMARNEFSGMGLRDSNPGSRQIYLTFPADSTFKEEDVSQYFSQYGPVQDVRIPYQQKRMFGFVTFVYPDTVNIILAKGNPHFVCNSRVLVKPYKEKGKLPDKKNHQQMERGDFSCSSPSGLDCRDSFDFQLGGRMFYSTQELLLKKKLEEQADFQQALEFQGRRFMNLQLADLKNQQHQLNVSVGSPVLSPNMSHAYANHSPNVPPLSNGMSQVALEESKKSPTEHDRKLAEKDNAALYDSNGNGNGNGYVLDKDEKLDHEESELPESFEHVLPDSLFASPTKSAYEHGSSVFSPALEEFDDIIGNTDSSMPTSTPLNMSPLKSCFLEMPRLSSGHGALGM